MGNDVKIEKFLNIVTSSYGYLKYLNLKMSSSNLNDFMSGLKSLNQPTTIENKILNFYPFEKESVSNVESYLSEYPLLLKYIPDSLKNDKEYMLNLMLKIEGGNFLDYVPANIKNNKDFIAGCIISNKFNEIVNHFNDEILKDYEFLSYLYGIKFHILKNTLTLSEDILFYENIIAQLLKDNHEESLLIRIGENLFYSYYYKKGLLEDNNIEFKTDDIKRLYKLLEDIGEKTSGKNSLKNDNLLLILDNLMNDEKNEIVLNDLENIYFEILNEKYLALVSMTDFYKRLYLVSNENSERFVKKLLLKNPKLFIFFSANLNVDIDYNKLIESTTNEEEKKMIKSHFLILCLSSYEFMVKYINEIAKVLDEETIKGVKKSFKGVANAVKTIFVKENENSLINTISLLKKDNFSNQTVFLKMVELIIEVKKYEMINSAIKPNHKSVENFKNTIAYVENEMGGKSFDVVSLFVIKNISSKYVNVILSYMLDNKYDKKDVDLLINKALENVCDTEKFINSSIFKENNKMRGMNKEEKINWLQGLGNKYDATAIYSKDIELKNSISLDNVEDIKFILSLLVTIVNFCRHEKDLGLPKNFLKDERVYPFLRSYLLTDDNVRIISTENKKMFNEKIFYDKDILENVLGTYSSLDVIYEIYGNKLNLLKDKEVWRKFITTNYSRESKKIRDADFFSFFAKEDGFDMLDKKRYKDVALKNLLQFKIWNEEYVKDNLDEVIKKVNAYVLIESVNDFEMSIKNDIYKKIFDKIISEGCNQSSNDLYLLLMKVAQEADMKNDDVLLKTLEIIEKYNFEIETELQKLMSNEKFKKVFNKKFGNVLIAEAMLEDDFFFKRIIAELNALEMKNNLTTPAEKSIKKVAKF